MNRRNGILAPLASLFGLDAPKQYLGQPGSRVPLALGNGGAAAPALPAANSQGIPAAQIRDNQPVRLASTGANIPLTGGTTTSIDGLPLALNDRVLLKDQSNGLENGVYVASQLVPTTTFTRAPDASTITNVAGFLAAVQAGAQNAGKVFEIVADPNSAVLGTTALSVVQVGPGPGLAVAPNASAPGSSGLMSATDKARVDNHGSHRARLVSTGNVALSGSTTTTIDSVAIQQNDRLLLAGQTNAPDNGLYIALQVTPTLTVARAPEMSTILQLAGAEFRIEAGASNAGTKWAVFGVDPDLATLASPGGAGTAIPIAQDAGTRPDPVNNLSVPQVVRVAFPAGVTGAADITILPSTVPYTYRVLDVILIVTTASGTSNSAVLHNATGGSGSNLSSSLSTTSTGTARNALSSATGTSGSGSPLVLRLGDGSAAGECIVTIQRQ